MIPYVDCLHFGYKAFNDTSECKCDERMFQGAFRVGCIHEFVKNADCYHQEKLYDMLKN